MRLSADDTVRLCGYFTGEFYGLFVVLYPTAERVLSVHPCESMAEADTLARLNAPAQVMNLHPVTKLTRVSL